MAFTAGSWMSHVDRLSPPLYLSSFRKTWGCGSVKTEKEIAAYNVIREQYRQLGPMCFGELSVLGLFSLLVLLWFTRDPGFMPGWATNVFNSEAEYAHILTRRMLHYSTPFTCLLCM